MEQPRGEFLRGLSVVALPAAALWCVLALAATAQLHLLATTALAVGAYLGATVLAVTIQDLGSRPRASCPPAVEPPSASTFEIIDFQTGEKILVDEDGQRLSWTASGPPFVGPAPAS